MALTHSLTWNYNASGLNTGASLTATSEQEINMDVVIPALSTDYLIAYALDYSQCKGLFIIGSAAMTIETNSSSAPAQTISLAAGVPVAWMYGSGTCPITADVTSLYITSTAGGTLTIRTLVDATV